MTACVNARAYRLILPIFDETLSIAIVFGFLSAIENASILLNPDWQVTVPNVRVDNYQLTGVALFTLGRFYEKYRPRATLTEHNQKEFPPSY